MTSSFDVIICGSGHVGSSLALALAQQGLNVAFIDSIIASARSENHNDNRVFALAAGSRTILESLGVWGFLHSHVTAIEHIHVSNKGSFGAARLHAHDFNHPALGYMVTATTLQTALNKAIENVKLTIFSPASLESFQTYDDRVEVNISTTNGPRQLSAQWLIGADGVYSTVRQCAGIGISTKKYHQHALVALIDLEHSHHFTAYERFVNDSAIALLPHTSWQSVLIWSGDDEMIANLMLLDDQAFLHQLQHAFGYRLGRFTTLSQRISYPLSQTKADAIHAKRLLLIGNAAQTLHPIGAQGFNLALRHVALLAHLLAKNKSLLTQEVLEDYVRYQETDTTQTMRFTDHLVNFSSRSGPLSAMARTILINTLGASTLAQRYLLKD